MLRQDDSSDVNVFKANMNVYYGGSELIVQVWYS